MAGVLSHKAIAAAPCENPMRPEPENVTIEIRDLRWAIASA